ncbi:MAG: UDP-N-acetylmuramoyl-L-alanyl-D-glutamate--2,6-diaminopimelate ligase [Sphingobacteriales bacterium]|jgi:UDP-N-acetylmuramoyl-L-alanyl-D-glutamate--2,6-diaminopimelate ligase|nr:MAG: UDP-N-acetylmuramoyl-L-alanyl-D-glutamate--2,6-diaminopimelate ligase [Sphingobacteriales bacterium]TAF46204.1 MAG: UDP-N-acetylmuramoyl-L-alanyl-D-glutamate--2,6-diaminopimelate ligase [Sphingobacteriales bacterium]TAF79101.1 MAG: UDP-N-acetylmuramoyl-L-alanyl-D-glutamate--2,6-diaminopimelate ligase [Sphingobacteriales bacterium]
MSLLKDILYGVAIEQVIGTTDMLVNALHFDSREVNQGSVFIAIDGTQTNGHQYINTTINQGAIAIICETLPDKFTDGVTYIKVANSAKALGIIAANFYHNPSQKLKLVGITGTNGKTTVATLLYQLFIALGYKTGLISTVENQINGKIIPSTHTTPNPIALNQLLADMVTQGCDYCFMEVSSHAIVQQRIAGVTFAGGVFTNITHDHLDFHKTFDNYIKAKKAFFDGLPKPAFALTNVDDKNGTVMLQNTQASKKTYALKTLANFKGKIIENQFSGLHLDVNGNEVYFKMVGSFNAYNLLAVYGTAILLEQDSLNVLTVLSTLSGAEGRFDYIISPNKIVGIVDYAHTPDAVQNVLSTISDLANGTEKVITIIGCGGDRDKTKRPIMARTACDWSDKVILTSDNPRTEAPEKIIEEMMVGVSPVNQKKVMRITDRREAIKTACHLAQPGDIILLAGKGHEKYQEINGVKTHFDDKEILTQQFNLLA